MCFVEYFKLICHTGRCCRDFLLSLQRMMSMLFSCRPCPTYQETNGWEVEKHCTSAINLNRCYAKSLKTQDRVTYVSCANHKPIFQNNSRQTKNTKFKRHNICVYLSVSNQVVQRFKTPGSSPSTKDIHKFNIMFLTNGVQQTEVPIRHFMISKHLAVKINVPSTIVISQVKHHGGVFH